ncbi:MAG TPA: class II glutamine amidotransferase, partial [Candidatus Dojkabacteria bacterium]|nr:class II glutamine amidotransferase [Candidatus Dojkabacteria bacterium]
MCGIFGYSGEKECNDLIFEGLKRLEYRGYDSWGIAILNGKIHQYKNIGEIKYDKMLQKLQKGNIGIGHTRWATHGGVTKINAHPHISEVGGFTLVQNGIVENFNELKSSLLKKDVHFVSETDTEVIVRLIELELLKNKSLRQAIITVFKKLKGRNTIALLSNNDKKIYAVRNGSPLVLGIATDGIYIASDTLSFSPATNEAVLLDDFDMVEIDGKNVSIYNIESNQFKPVKIKKLKHQFNKIDKGNFKHFML